MDSIDDFESAAARAWDETSNVSRTALQTKPTDDRDAVLGTGLGKLSSQPFDSSKRTAATENVLGPQLEWRHTRPDSSNVKLEPSQIVQQIGEVGVPYYGNSFLSSNVKLKVPRSGYKPIFQVHKGKSSAPWAATPGLVTYRRQAELEKEAQKAINEEMYLKSPPPGLKQSITGHHLLLSNNVLPEQLSGERLDKIRTTCRVYVEHDVTYRSLIISSDQITNVLEAINQIKAATLHFKIEADAFAPLYIVEPPSESAMTEDVCPVYMDECPEKILANDISVNIVAATTRKIEATSDSKINKSLIAENYRAPIVRKVVLSGRRLSEDKIQEWVNDRNEHIATNGNLILEYVRRSFQNLHGLQSKMRLHAHFGHLEIHHYQKSFQKPGIPYRNFVKMMESSRTKALFNKRISNRAVASRLVHQIQVSSDCFSPLDALTSSLADVKPKQTFVMFARAPSNELLRVEADIDVVNDGNKTNYQIGTTNYYLHGARKTRLEVGVMNFESGYDWFLELVTNDLVDTVPEAFRHLVNSCLRAGSTEKIDQYGFSYPEIIVVDQPGLTVVDAQIKTTLQYRVTGTSYVIELSIYRFCNGSRGLSSLFEGLGVSFFSTDWDFSMGLTHGPTPDQEPGTDLKGLFPFTSNVDGFRDFLLKVKEVQIRLRSVSSCVN